MDQELLRSNLNALERKVIMLINEHKNTKDALNLARRENDELRNALKGRDEQLANFKNQIKITKIVDSINPEDESASELKRKIDEYIREIDQCIAHLSR